MGKKWKRVRLEDLADAEKQKEILGLLQANGQAEPESPQHRPSETATTGR
ncbi:MAG: hypothetical protein Q7O12_15540 [Deltaproteobacteria bacterium]|nr:hypothetical protein [Deltaproteobacteria bacterium]